MAFDMVKFERGQVWMIRGKSTAVGHEQMKDRPWLILSIGKFNQSSGMVTCVPITTRDRIVSPAQVLFVNTRGLNNVVLCEQIRTFDHKSGDYIFDFMGNLSDEVMESVDVALSTHLGIHYSPVSLKSLYDSMEAVVRSVAHLQQKDAQPKFTDADIVDFARKLQQFAVSELSPEKVQELPQNPAHADGLHATIIPAEYITPTVSEVACTNTAEDVPKDTNVVDNSKEPVDPPKAKSPRNQWTTEKCKEFLTDADNLPMKQVMEKWNITRKAGFYSTRYYVQNLLNQAESK